jgi:hypothetical protein
VLQPAGKSQTTFGLGRQSLWTCENGTVDSSGLARTCNQDGTGKEKVIQSKVFQGSLDYRLGLRDTWGPFPGAEIEWHLEAPTNPATMEFVLNLALPAGSSFNHKIGGGWGIGAWADNSLFMEYALSRKWGAPLFFTNFRATWLATQIDEVMRQDFSQALPRNQILIGQAGMGMQLKLPSLIIVPDFLISQLNITYPQVPFGSRKFRRQDIALVQADLNFGLGWNF